MKIFFTIFILLFSLNIFCQTKKIIIQIDTLELKNGGINQINFTVNVDNKYWTEKYINFEDDTTIEIAYKYRQEIEIKNDTSKIFIPIDNHGSRIILTKNFLLLSDTIKLSKVIVYERLANTTIKCQTEYINPRRKKYKVINTKTSSNEIKSKINIENLQIKINDSLYSIKSQYVNSYGIVSTSHGYNKRNYQFNNGNYKYGIRRFYSQCRTKNEIIEFKINL